jgi:hypothetical protein
MLAVGWVDSKAVYFVSTADTTDIVTVNRKIGSSKVDVRAPSAVAKYNKFMGGVDHHDCLHSTFSLCKKHHFKKLDTFDLTLSIMVGPNVDQSHGVC